MKLPDLNSKNPAPNPLLTKLKKNLVELWAIPARRYVEESGIEASVKETIKFIDGKSQYRNLADLQGEFSPAHIFGAQSFATFLFAIDGLHFTVLIPDYMDDEAKERFWESISLAKMPVTKMTATKIGRSWRIEMVK